jgi:hypothetical protein
MTSRRRRPHYRPAAIGYRASHWKARLPRQTGLTGVHLRSVLRFTSGFHPTRPRGKDLGCTMPASTPCSCLRLLVASNGPHKGLSPSIIHPCPTHLPPRPRPRLQPHTLVPLVNPAPEPSYSLVQEIQPGHGRKTVFRQSLARHARVVVVCAQGRRALMVRSSLSQAQA